LKLDENATKAERYAKVIEFVNGRYQGLAAAANEGLGGTRGLAAAFGDFQEQIGEKFAPLFTAAIQKLTSFFKALQNDEVANFTTALITAGLVVTSLGVAIPAAVTGLGLFRAAMAAAGIATTGTKLAIQGLVAATGIGLLVIALTELYLHWDTVSVRIKAIVQGLVTFVTGAFSGLGKVLSGAFSLDINQIKAGLEEVKAAFSKGAEQATAELPKKAEEATKKQNSVMKAAAAQRQADQDREDARRRAADKAQQELTTLILQQGTAAQIELKRAEVEALKQMAGTHNQEQLALLQERVEQIRAYEDEQRALDLERHALFREEDLAARSAEDLQDFEYTTAIGVQKRAAIEAQLMTEKDVEQKILLDKTAQRVKTHNQLLEDTKKFGLAFAVINQALASDEVQGTKKATGELVALQGSKQRALFHIGKEAAKAQVIMKTAESAMNIYAGFSSIPFIGPVLGIAGALAAIAYGGEQLSAINNTRFGAQRGALVSGYGVGDRVPFMLEPGELVAPKKNFEEVVSSVQYTREIRSSGNAAGSGQILIGFDGPEASRVITARQVEDRALGISVEGSS
jgi:hypothetical protein